MCSIFAYLKQEEAKEEDLLGWGVIRASKDCHIHQGSGVRWAQGWTHAQKRPARTPSSHLWLTFRISTSERQRLKQDPGLALKEFGSSSEPICKDQNNIFLLFDSRHLRKHLSVHW